MWQFIVISTSILALIYGYTGWRIIGPSRFGPIATTILWLFIAICAVTPALVLTARSQRIESWWSELLGWLGFLSMGLFLFAFVFVLARDLLLIIGVGGPKLFEIARSAFGGAEATAGFDAERRAFLVQATNAGIVALSGGMTGYGVYSARRAPPVKRVSIALKNLPAAFDGFRIAQITDIHAGPTIKRPFVEAVSDTVRELGADMIALTGDIVDGSVARLADDVAPLGGIDAPCGRYFVTGNHEYYSGAEAWIAHLERLGRRLGEACAQGSRLCAAHERAPGDRAQWSIAGRRGRDGLQPAPSKWRASVRPGSRVARSAERNAEDIACAPADEHLFGSGRGRGLADIRAYARWAVLSVELRRVLVSAIRRRAGPASRHADIREPGHGLLGAPAQSRIAV